MSTATYIHTYLHAPLSPSAVPLAPFCPFAAVAVVGGWGVAPLLHPDLHLDPGAGLLEHLPAVLYEFQDSPIEFIGTMKIQ